MRLTVLYPAASEPGEEKRLGRLWAQIREGHPQCLRTAADLRTVLQQGEQLKNTRILVLAAIGETGINLELMAMLREIRLCGDCMEGGVGALIVDGAGEQNTKSVGKHIAWTMNMAGCLLIGRPLAEGTGSLLNCQVLASRWQTGLEEAYFRSAGDLLHRLLAFEKPSEGSKQLLCLHASNKKTSNTLRLWGKVRRQLPPDISVKEIALRNGEIRDCIGCHYDTCMYFSSKSSCYFGGTIVEEVYPALEECDALVMLCPNFNDAIGANLTATINRLTALFRRMPFDRKYLFALIVSGYSGGDIVGRQLIGALNMNKSFILPPHFALMEMANAAGSIEQVPDIDGHAAAFAEHITKFLTGT